MTDNFKETISSIKKLRLAQEENSDSLYAWTTFDNAMVAILERYVEATSSRNSTTGELEDKTKIFLFCFILEKFFDLSLSSHDDIDYIFLAEKYMTKFKEVLSAMDDAYFHGLPSLASSYHTVQSILNSDTWKIDATKE